MSLCNYILWALAVFNLDFKILMTHIQTLMIYYPYYESTNILKMDVRILLHANQDKASKSPITLQGSGVSHDY